MRLLLDTHLLLWAAASPSRLSPRARELIVDSRNSLLFSAASVWEVSIKASLGRDDLRVEPMRLHASLLEHGYAELHVSGAHAVALRRLPAIHKDPFDRILLAQAAVEELVLVTSDATVASYPGPVELV